MGENSRFALANLTIFCTHFELIPSKTVLNGFICPLFFIHINTLRSFKKQIQGILEGRVFTHCYAMVFRICARIMQPRARCAGVCTHSVVAFTHLPVFLYSFFYL